MSTLSEASLTVKRQRSFIGKPRKISSGVPLTRVQRVAHRSDILLDDQICLVTETQNALEKAMACMAAAKDPREQVAWLREVDKLKLQCDETLLILKVVSKLNSELLYAKAEVEQASKIGGDVGAARKRVVWLEDRMENLLSRYRNDFRLDSPIPIQPMFLTEKRTRPRAGRVSTHHTKRGETAECGRPKSILKVPGRIEKMVEDGDEDAKTNQSGGGGGGGEVQNRSRQQGTVGKYIVREQKEILGGRETDETWNTSNDNDANAEWVDGQHLALRSRGRPGVTGERGGRGDVGRMQRVKQVDSDDGDSDEDSSDLTERQNHVVSRRSRPGGASRRTKERVKRKTRMIEDERNDDDDDDDGDHEEDDTDKEQEKEGNMRPEGAGGNGGRQDAGGIRKTNYEKSVAYGKDDSSSLSENSDTDDVTSGMGDGIFMTEGAARGRVNSSASSKGKGIQPEVAERSSAQRGEGKEDEEEEDMAAAYWQSPHHMFEFSEHRDAISRENPMSYHNLGLAVCSSFIQPAPETAAELPWRPTKKGEQLSDVHVEGKVALDKLAERIHHIWGKMEDAVATSTDIISPVRSPERESTFLSQIEGSLPAAYAMPLLPIESKRSSAMKGYKCQSQTKMSSVRVKSVVKSEIPLPSTTPPRTMSSTVPMLMYHPKPIPPPAVLPLTRTNHQKTYPRISSDWNDDDPELTERTLRLVNQMNVAKETNLLVYKSKESKRKKSSRNTLMIKQESIAPSKRWRNATRVNDLAADQITALMGSKHGGKGKMLQKDEPRWKRVQHILEMLVSDRVIERRDAARHLGELDVVDQSVIEALSERLDNDEDTRVCYEAAKSLMTIGQWTQPAITLITRYLVDGNYQAKRDLVQSMIKARNNSYLNKTKPYNKQLIVSLKNLCATDDTGDLGFDCAVCLGCLCVPDSMARQKLMGSLSSKDINVTARSLEILVRQMHASEPAVVKMVLHQLQFSSAWKYRAAAAKLLLFIGPKCLSTDKETEDIFIILDKRLYDDPSREVCSEIAHTMTALGMRDMLVDLVERRLFHDDDDERAHGVLAVGVLGMKSERILRTLLEMLELDSCEYVRIQVIRTFSILGLTNVKIMRSLKNWERTEGALAREAFKALKILNAIKQQHIARSPNRSPTRSSSLLASSGTGTSRKGAHTPILKRVICSAEKSPHQSI